MTDPKTLMLIRDTGVTPFRSDFIDYVKCDIPVMDVTKVNKVIGIGTTLHKLTDTNGWCIFHVCRITYLRQTFVCSLHKLTTKCTVDIRKSMATA